METLSNKIIPYTLLNAEYADFSFDPHEHHTLEIVYVNRGTVQFSFFDDTPTGGVCQQVPVKSNQFVILMPRQTHCYEIREQAEVAVLELGYKNAALPLNQWLLHGEYAQKLAFSAKLFSTDRKYLIFDDTQAVFGTLNKFIELVYAQQHGIRSEYFEVEYEIRLLELLVKVCRCNQLLVDRVHANRHIYNTLLYIAENYAKKISISQIAAFVKVSPSYLQRIFKESYGQSILNVVTRQRILVAEKLLTDTNMPLTEISRNVGYADKRAFQLAFKRVHGMTPSDYRVKNRENKFIFYRDYENPASTRDELLKNYPDK